MMWENFQKEFSRKLLDRWDSYGIDKMKPKTKMDKKLLFEFV